MSQDQANDRVDDDQTPAPGHTPPPPSGPRSKPGRWLTILLLSGLAAGGAGIGAGILTGVLPNPFAASKPSGHGHAGGGETIPLVKAVRPKKETSLAITVEQLATVEPYYQADLRARASGIVKKVHRDIGDAVKKDDLLVEIDVPESEQEVARLDAVVLQRRQELKVSEAKLKDMNAAREVSGATIKQREADVKAARATRDLKKRKFERFQALALRGTVVGSVVEEEERDYLSSDAAVASASANVDRARADYSESEARVEGAAADIELKQAQIEVAIKDLDRAKAIANYAKILAPFDGVVVRRTVDPGSFVQNATTGTSEILISVARIDIVTVSARFPDRVGPSINNGTPAEVQIDDLPGVTISAKVSRFAPSVQNADRTMRVEVDLFNGSEEEYRQLSAAIQAGGPNKPTKGINDAMPVRAFPPEAAGTRRLLPGMTATITLSIGSFGESYVLPSTAVYTRSGTPYILLAHDGKTRQVPVRVQLTDGKTVRVALPTRRQDPDGKAREVLADLTGREEVIVARQLELGDGATVKVGLADW